MTLMGVNRIQIVQYVSRVLSDQDLYKHMSRRKNPYDDGKAAVRIVKGLSC